MLKEKIELLSSETKAQIDHWLTKFPTNQRQSALLPALTIAQKANGGWLTDEIIKTVADYLQVPHIAGFEAATFYSMFDLEPVGKYKVNVCTNISCMLCGSEKILEYLEQRLQIKAGQTTRDGKITLRETECLAACVNAPAMQINNRYYENLNEEKIDTILKELV